jgi:hypothetical protein
MPRRPIAIGEARVAVVPAAGSTLARFGARLSLQAEQRPFHHSRGLLRPSQAGRPEPALNKQGACVPNLASLLFYADLKAKELHLPKFSVRFVLLSRLPVKWLLLHSAFMPHAASLLAIGLGSIITPGWHYREWFRNVLNLDRILIKHQILMNSSWIQMDSEADFDQIHSRFTEST